MNTWPSLFREGAIALSPQDVAKGNREMRAILESAARCIGQREALFTALKGGAGGVIVIGCFVYLIFKYQEPPATFAANVALAAIALSATLLALAWWGWSAIQNGRIGARFGKLSGVTIPEELQQLIDSFASGVRDARTASGGTVLPDLFASRWAIMLFSHDHRQRLWVRAPNGEKQKEEIFARPVQPEPAAPTDAIAAKDTDDEPPLRNTDPAIAWLVDGTAQHFAAGRDAFLDTLPSHQVDAYRLILTIARRELRKGGQPGAQEEAIRIILAELKNKGLLIRGTSRATIMKLLHGQHRGADIRGYFA